MARRHITADHVRRELEQITDDIAEQVNRRHEVLVRVDAAGGFYVDRTPTDDD